MKYKILRDYGVYEGMKFEDQEFDTVDEAVKHAIGMNHCTPFLIVKVINWEATLLDQIREYEKKEKGLSVRRTCL